MALTKVSTDGVKDDAITKTKIPANQIEASELANNAVDTNAIQDDAVTGVKIAPEIDNSHITNAANIAGSKLADNSISLAKLLHGDSNNDGKFLRANNGADPTFETVTGTTINNNADNRVITGSGTANTLEGESTLTYDGTTLDITKASGNAELSLISTGGSGKHFDIRSLNSNGRLAIGTPTNNHILLEGSSNNIILADNDGVVGIGLTNPESYDSYANQLVVAGSSHAGITIRGNYASTGNIYFADGTSGGEKYDGFVSYSYPTQRLALGTGGTTRVRVTNDGLCFHGDTAAANALDDYEEGGFTVTFHNTWTNMSSSDVRHAKYVKIGGLVHIYIEFFMSGNNGGWQTASYLGGFPFTGLSSYYSPVNLAVMYGPSGYDMDGSAAGRAYFDANGKELYMRMGTFSGVRHLWLDFTYRTT